MKASFVVLLALFCQSILLNAQFRLDNFKSYTSFYEGKVFAYDNVENLWVGTNGGAYKYSMKEGKIVKEIRNIDELTNFQINTIEINPSDNKIYFGTESGNLDILTPNDTWEHITDIKVKGFTNPAINDIVFYNDNAYLACGFGLTVFDAKNNVFSETVQKFGTFTTNTQANKILIHKNLLYVGTNEGLVYTDLNKQISDPNNWKIFEFSGLTPSRKILDLTAKGDSIFVMTEKVIYSIKDTNLIEYATTSEEQMVNFNSIDPNKLGFTTEYYVFKARNDAFFVKNFTLINKAINFTYNNEKFLAISYRNNAIGIVRNDSLYRILPNSPISNNIGDIKVLNDGSLFITSSQEGMSGIMKYSDSTWTNYIPTKYPGLKNTNYFRINPIDNDKIYASNYGGGFLFADLKKDSFLIYNQTNSPLTGITEDPKWIITGESQFDKNGVLWVVNYGMTSPGPILVAIDKNMQFSSFENKNNVIERYFINLAIDNYGTKWLGSNTNGNGLYYFNENKTLNDPTDDKYKFINMNTSSGLPSNAQNDIKVDKNGWVWIGTPEGLAVVRNPSAVLSSNSNVDISYIKRLGALYIHDIMIDAQNNKWLATNSGIWVLSEDASEVIANITAQNSKLPTNEILSLATNEMNGKIYIGTKVGLYEAQSYYIKPATTYDIVCYPQPFNTLKDNLLVIEGLENQTEIKITSVDGNLIKTINTLSRTALWDGTDENGNRVGDGIYLVIAYSGENATGAVGKIAIIRK